MAKLCFISDTHGLHDQVNVEPCDVLIHCGDCTNDRGQKSLRGFIQWLDRQPAEHKILIAGNHDWAFEKWPDLARLMVEDTTESVTYLENSGCIIDDTYFWGSPYTPRFFDWAFNCERGADIKRHWDMIPDCTDVLITHGPPKGFLDYNLYDRFHCGCEMLIDRVIDVHPKIHAFGHIHSGYGKAEVGEIEHMTTLINASVVNERYKVVNPPHYIDL